MSGKGGMEDLNLGAVARMLNFHGTQILEEMCRTRSDYVDIYQLLIQKHRVDLKSCTNERLRKSSPNYSEMNFLSALRPFILEKFPVLFRDMENGNVPVMDAGKGFLYGQRS